MPLNSYFFFFIPIISIIIYSFSCRKRGELKTSKSTLYFYALLYILLIGLYPAEPGGDKERYLLTFLNADLLINDTYKDIGWVYYNYFLKLFIGDLSWLFFTITAFIYVSSYIAISIKKFPSDYQLIFIILSFSLLGFSAYGMNTIRAGFGLSLFFWGVSQKDNNLDLKEIRFSQLILFSISVIIHRSMLLPIFAYLFSIYFKKIKLIELFWIICLTLSIINVDLTTYYEDFGILGGDRVNDYLISENEDPLYKTGFRLDFLIYSIFPILFVKIGVKNLYKDNFFRVIYQSYLIGNSFWLLVIRAPYTDRFAYLSWCLIPLLIIYPLSKHLCFTRLTKFMLISSTILLISINLMFNNPFNTNRSLEMQQSVTRPMTP